MKEFRMQGEKNISAALYTVRICDTPQEFTAYLIEKTGKTPEQGSSTFLKYNRPEKSEVIFVTGTTQTDIVRHLFVQYLYSYIKEPPAWLLGGFSLHAENFSWSKEHGFFSANEINPWLSPAKKLLASEETALSPQQIMNAAKNDYPAEILYPQAWLLVSYFEETSHPILKRLLPEGMTELRLRGNSGYISVGERESGAIFTSYIDKWSSWDELNEDFARYTAELHTPSEILRDGMDSYTQNRYSDAEAAFTAVLELEPRNNTAAYYLGLIAYNQERYDDAERWYQQALANGADTALLNWALGANAYSAKQFNNAIIYLKAARILAPDIYGVRVDELLETIPVSN